MDHFDDCDPPIASPPNTKANLVVGGLLTTLAIGPGLLWWYFQDPIWATGWLLLLLLGLDG